MTPTVAEQRQQFDDWFNSPGHQAYMAKVAARGGTPLDDPERAFELYRLRWKQPRPRRPSPTTFRRSDPHDRADHHAPRRRPRFTSGAVHSATNTRCP